MLLISHYIGYTWYSYHGPYIVPELVTNYDYRSLLPIDRDDSWVRGPSRLSPGLVGHVPIL